MNLRKTAQETESHPNPIVAFLIYIYFKLESVGHGNRLQNFLWPAEKFDMEYL